MKPLRLRMTFFVVMLAIVGGGSILMGLRSFLDIQNQNQDIRRSFILRDWVQKLPGQPVRDSVTKELQTFRAQIDNPERQSLLSDVIQSYTANNQRLLKKRTEAFLSAEKKFLSEQDPRLTHLEDRFFFYGLISFFSLVGLLAVLRSLLVRTVFSHIEQMTKKMVDFLNGRYSYKFEVPSPNEVGELQSSFNAMAQRVLQNMEDLKTLDNAKSEFLSIASHELRTPMTSIKGSLGLLNSGIMGDIPKDAQHLLTIAETETDRLIRLINDILDMAKIEAGKLPLKTQWESLSSLLQETQKGLIGFAETAGVPLELSLPSEVEVHVDKDRIQQVITNLASNAIKFSPRGQPVILGFDKDSNSNQIRVTVKDHGRGISPDDQMRIFEKFRQATSSDNPLVKGTGLGLAIAKALIEEHNGAIGVESTPGKGSTFYFTLPQWRVPTQSPNQSIDSPEENETPTRIAA